MAPGISPTQQPRVVILAARGDICTGTIPAPLATTATPSSELMGSGLLTNPHTARPAPGTTAPLIRTLAMAMDMIATITTHTMRVTPTVTARLGGTEATLGGESAFVVCSSAVGALDVDDGVALPASSASSAMLPPTSSLTSTSTTAVEGDSG